MIAHDVVSACISAIIRLYYAVKIRDSKYRTYGLTKAGLWTLSEIASGVLALCLPLSLKFVRGLKESSLWLHLSSFSSFSRLKIPALRTVGTHSGEHAATKGSGRWSRLKRKMRKYNHVNNEQGTQNGHLMEMPSRHVVSTTNVDVANQLQTPPTPHPGLEGLESQR